VTGFGEHLSLVGKGSQPGGTTPLAVGRRVDDPDVLRRQFGRHVGDRPCLGPVVVGPLGDVVELAVLGGRDQGLDCLRLPLEVGNDGGLGQVEEIEPGGGLAGQVTGLDSEGLVDVGLLGPCPLRDLGGSEPERGQLGDSGHLVTGADDYSKVPKCRGVTAPGR
jgi:hypothetical protein